MTSANATSVLPIPPLLNLFILFSCKKDFKKRDQVEDHFRQAHSNLYELKFSDPVEFRPDLMLKKFQTLTCPDCNFVSENEEDVRLHRFKKHEHLLDRILSTMNIFHTLMPVEKAPTTLSS